MTGTVLTTLNLLNQLSQILSTVTATNQISKKKAEEEKSNLPKSQVEEVLGQGHLMHNR